jgi:6-phosphogluconolactonase
VTPNLRIAPTPAAVAELAAGLIAGWIEADRANGAAVHVALAGGTTPAGTYRRLADLVSDWSDVHLWFGDERMVPPDDPAANARLVGDQLIAPAPVPPVHVHRVPTTLPVDIAASRYADEITRIVAPNERGLPCFSVVVLGLGPDGHVASLFPGSAGLRSEGVCIPVHDSPKPPSERVSLSLPVINAADRRIVIATGSAKAPALARALGPPGHETPASMLRSSGTVVVVDVAAAASLSPITATSTD